MYVHKDSLGTNPQICKTDPIYGKSGLTCPGGILRKKYALRKTCRITIRCLRSFTNIIHESHTNTFVILSQVSPFRMRHWILCLSSERRSCQNSPPERHFLPSTSDVEGR